jgi:hypothetical protein
MTPQSPARADIDDRDPASIARRAGLARPADRVRPGVARRRGGGPRAGLVLAVGVGLVSAGVIALFAMRSSGTGSAKNTPGTIDPAAKGTLPVADITQTGLRGTGEARVQLVDRSDPSRVAGLMTWTRLEPLPGGRANVNVPRAFVYLRDGRTIHLSAERGVLLFAPGSQEPESGVLEGKVRIALFAPAAQGQILDPEKAAPIATLTTSAITFDRALVEVATTREFEIASDLVRARGRGLRLQGNQAAEQLEFLELDELIGDASVSLRPTRSAGASADTAADRTSPGVVTEGRAGPAASPREAFYRLDIIKPLTARLGSRIVRSATTIAGVRLVDGRLNLDQRETAGTPGESADAPQGAPAQARAGDATPGELLVRFDGPLTIRAIDAEQRSRDGLDRDDAVAVLTGTPGFGAAGIPIFVDEAARISADGTKVTLLAGPSRESSGAAGGGLGTLELQGDDQRPATLAAEGRGVVESRRIALDVRTGIGSLQGPGEIRAARPEASRLADRSLSWTGPGWFVLSTARGNATAELREATVTGDVLARDAGSRVRAGALRAVFAPAGDRVAEGGGSGDAPLRLSRVELRQGALAESLGALARLVGPPSDEELSRVQSLSADAISVLLDTSRADTPPTRVLALGDVIARAGRTGSPVGTTGADSASVNSTGGVLQAEFIDALLGPDAERPTQNTPTTIIATSPTQVIYTDVGGSGSTGSSRRTVAFAPRVMIDARRQTAELLGEQQGESPRLAGISQSSGEDRSQSAAEITAPRIIVRATDSTLDVPGPGTLVVRQSSRSSEAEARTPDAADVAGPGLLGEPRLRVSWSTGLRVNDATGSASATGNIEAISTPTGLQRDTLRAERLDMTFARAGASGSGRELSRAEAIGQPGERPRASVESRRFALAAASADGSTAEPLLDRLLFLEGERIIASQTGQTLEVPGPGRLLVDDRRSTPASGAVGIGDAAATTGSTASRGTSLFSWTGGLTLDQSAGSMNMRDSVRLIHRPAVSSQPAPNGKASDANLTLASIVTLDCDTLSAMVRTQPASAADAGAATNGTLGSQLLNVTAEGNVRAASGSQELSADTARFDAIGRRLTAGALADRWVTFLDSARPTPVQARTLTWDIDGGRYEATDLRPVTLPR